MCLLPNAALLSRFMLVGAIGAAIACPAFAQPPPVVSVRPAARQQALVPQLQPMLIMTGELGGTFVQVGSDLAAVAAEPGFQLLPVMSHGSYDNVLGLLNTRGVDLGLVATDALAYARGQANLPGLAHVQYIAKLYDQEMHLLARDPALRTIADLAGRRVNIDADGSGTSITSAAVFKALGVNAIFTHEASDRGVEMLRGDEVDAVAYVIGKPGRLFRGLPGDGMHLLSVPMNDALLRSYLPASFTAADYPNLVQNGQDVPSLAVSVVLACFGWPADTERYRALERFSRLFVERFGELQKPPHYAKWHEVSLSATVPGWTRFAPVERLLQAARVAAPVERDAAFEAFLASIGRGNAVGAERERLRVLFGGLKGTGNGR